MLPPNTRYHGTEDAIFRRANNSLEKGIASGRLTETDVALIKKYTLRLKQGLSAGRFAKITYMLVSVRRYFDVEYAKVTEVDYLEALSKIKYAKRDNGTPYTANCITDWLKITKRFFKFLHTQNMTTVPLEVIEETQTGGYDYYTKTEDDVLTADEINRIIAAAHTPKYKAYFGMLYELGARSIELANLRWQDLTFNEWGISCNLRDAKAGRTPKIRTVPCVMYAKYVSDWRSQYPGDPTGENFVFVTPSKKPFSYRAVEKALGLFAKEAGIERHVTLHRFRHTRITHVLREGMNETLCKKAFWGNQSTAMIGTYGHLTSSDLENEYMRLAGINVERKNKDESPKPIHCPQCHHVCPPGSKICPNCGKALTKDVEDEINDGYKTLDDLFKRLSDAERYQVLGKLSQFIQAERAH